MKKLIALLLTAVMVLSLTACVPATPDNGSSSSSSSVHSNREDDTPEDQRYGGHLNMAIYNLISYLDPAKSTGLFQYMWTSMVFEAPLTRDAEGVLRPNVCDFELSEDQLTLKLWVRDGVTFHDGTLVEIEDVVASIRRTVHTSPRDFVEAYIEDVVIEGDVATFTFTEYNEKTLYYIGCVHPFIGVMPKEIAEYYSEDSMEFIQSVEDCIGTGPYKVSGFVPEVLLELERHEGYVPVEGNYSGFAAPKKAYIDSYTIHCCTDGATFTLALLNGDLDIFSGVSSDYDAQVQANGLIKLRKPSATATTLQFNTRGSSIVNTSADMRKAICAAIDMDQMISVLTDGVTTKAGFCPVLNEEYYTDVFETADYMGPANIELSKQYQQKAGYNGEVIEIRMSSDYANVVTMVKNYTALAGINCEIVMMEGTSFSELVNDPGGDWIFTWTNPGINTSPTLLSTNLMDTNYASEAKDDLWIELQKMEVGTEEYIAKWHELAAQMVYDCPTVYINQNALTWTMHPDLIFDYDGFNPYFFNAYWTNPEAHGK